MSERRTSSADGDPAALPGASPRRHGRPNRPDDDERDDLYGQDSFPASDPPSTWWGEGKDTAGPGNRIIADDDSERLHRAAGKLARRGRTGVGPTQATTRYRQLELAELLVSPLPRSNEANRYLANWCATPRTSPDTF